MALALECLLKDSWPCRSFGQSWPPASTLMLKPLVPVCGSWDKTRSFTMVSPALRVQVSALKPSLLILLTQDFFCICHLFSLWASRSHPPAHTAFPQWPVPDTLRSIHHKPGSRKSKINSCPLFSHCVCRTSTVGADKKYLMNTCQTLKELVLCQALS